MKKVCLFLLMLVFSISASSKELKYHPKTKDELKELIENESIYLGDIDTSAITDMSYLFIRGAKKIDACGTAYEYIITKRKNFSGIGKWDTSNVTDMEGLFYKMKDFNEDISAWNTSRVKNMSSMFEDADSFDKALNNWDVSEVKTMKNMFRGAISFNQPLNKWNVSEVMDMEEMFEAAYKFNQR